MENELNHVRKTKGIYETFSVI